MALYSRCMCFIGNICNIIDQYIKSFWVSLINFNDLHIDYQIIFFTNYQIRCANWIFQMIKYTQLLLYVHLIQYFVGTCSPFAKRSSQYYRYLFHNSHVSNMHITNSQGKGYVTEYTHFTRVYIYIIYYVCDPNTCVY